MTKRKKAGQTSRQGYQQLELNFAEDTGRVDECKTPVPGDGKGPDKKKKPEAKKKQGTKKEPQPRTFPEADRSERLSKAERESAEEELEAVLCGRQDVFVGRIMRICRVSSNQAELILEELKRKGRITKTGWKTKDPSSKYTAPLTKA